MLSTEFHCADSPVSMAQTDPARPSLHEPSVEELWLYRRQRHPRHTHPLSGFLLWLALESQLVPCSRRFNNIFSSLLKSPAAQTTTFSKWLCHLFHWVNGTQNRVKCHQWAVLKPSETVSLTSSFFLMLPRFTFLVQEKVNRTPQLWKFFSSKGVFYSSFKLICQWFLTWGETMVEYVKIWYGTLQMTHNFPHQLFPQILACTLGFEKSHR